MAAHAVIAARRNSNSHPEDEASRVRQEIPAAAQQPLYGNDALLTVPGAPTSTVVVGDVCVEGSADVVIDNVTVFEGPVTVQQVHVGNGLPAKVAKDAEAGGDNYDEEVQTCGMGPCAFRWALGILALTLGIIVLIVLLATLLSSSGEDVVGPGDKTFDEDAEKDIAAKIDVYNGKDLLLVSRREWGGRPPSGQADPMTHPVPYVIISHTATEHCLTFDDCAAVVRSVQSFHMDSRKWWDVGYNFLVGGDGRAYEGRGWDGVGAHARSYNNISIGLSFIGTFTDVEPPRRQVNAALRLVEEGVKLGKLSENYGIMGHRQVSSTESPGEKLFQMLTKWPHWTEPDS